MCFWTSLTESSLYRDRTRRMFRHWASDLTSWRLWRLESILPLLWGSAMQVVIGINVYLLSKIQRKFSCKVLPAQALLHMPRPDHPLSIATLSRCFLAPPPPIGIVSCSSHRLFTQLESCLRDQDVRPHRQLKVKDAVDGTMFTLLQALRSSRFHFFIIDRRIRANQSTRKSSIETNVKNHGRAYG